MLVGYEWILFILDYISKSAGNEGLELKPCTALLSLSFSGSQEKHGEGDWG
jgi:hypothetical protein